MRSLKIFTLSKVDMKSWDEIKRRYLHAKPFGLSKSQNMKQIKDAQFDESRLTISTTFEEKLIFSFSDLIKEAEVYAVTEIILKLYENSFLMISSSSGLGMMVRGDARNYIDTIIGPLFMKTLDVDIEHYHPINLPENLMSWSFWGEELRNIAVDIPKLGLVSLKGRDINSKIKFEPTFDHILSKGSIGEIKVHSNKRGRVITISRRGIIKAQVNNFVEFAEFLMGKIEESSILG